MSARVVSVNTGGEVAADWGGGLRRTAIDKRPAASAVAVGALGLAGDEQADKVNHGGPDQAVYAYAREDLDWWAGRLGRELRGGMFGENVTTEGLDVSGAVIGETWRLGGVVVQVTSPRIPCVVFRNWMDEKGWIREFRAAGRPGAYLRVLQPVSKRSRPETTRCLHSSILFKGTRLNPIALGRVGESNAKTPIKGRSSSLKPYLNNPFGLT